MVELVAPNGGAFQASDEAAPLLLAEGWSRPRAAAPGPADGAACEQGTDLMALTAAKLRAMCAERGIEPPKKATKAQLAELLGE